MSFRVTKYKFFADASGDTSIKLALLLGGVAIALAILIAPALESATETYAENKAFGIDRVLTGSINNSKRYRVRKSVLDQEYQEECWQSDNFSCVTRD